MEINPKKTKLGQWEKTYEAKAAVVNEVGISVPITRAIKVEKARPMDEEKATQD